MKLMQKGGVYLTLFATFFFWGSIYVAGKMISDAVPAALVAGLRCLIAVFPLMLMARQHRDVKIERGDWIYFVAVGAFGYFSTIVLIQYGIAYTGASMASLINSLTPVGVTICAALILKEKITPVKILCLVLALTGTWIITWGAESRGEMLGIFLCMISVVSWSLASVFMRRLTAKYPPIMVTAYGMAFSLIFHAPLSIGTIVAQGGVHFDLRSVLILLYLGVVGSGLSQFTWTKSLSRLPASTCSLFYPLQPAFSAILGALLLKETFAPTFFVGMLLICADVVINVKENQRLAHLEAERGVN